MSDQNAQEPTMEEILASIRRIISEDDAPAEAPAAATDSDDTPAPEPEPASEPEPETVFAPEPAPEPPPPVVAAPEEEEDDVLELTDPLASAAVETHGDLEIYSAEPEPAPLPASFDPEPRSPPPAAARSEDSLLSEVAARAGASAFGSLHAAIAMPPSGLTLDEVVRELLKPLLAAWLDEHLPRIVEAKVEEEVQRIARR
jgi:cell pole-organizing protein PopZ